MKELQQDLIYYMGKVERTEAASLDNSALVNPMSTKLEIELRFCAQKKLSSKFRAKHFDFLSIFLM